MEITTAKMYIVFCRPTTKVSRARDRGNYSLDVYIVFVLFIFFTILGWATLLAKLCGNKPTDGMNRLYYSSSRLYCFYV